MDKATLARNLYRTAHLTGEFHLRSGAVSHEYFDKYRFEADPTLLRAVADHLAPLVPQGTEVLAGLELGGVPIATALSLTTGLPAAFVRKVAKTYGTGRLAEGVEVADLRVCIVEDVVTSGGQVILSARDLRALGAEIVGVLCVVERDPAGRAALAREGLTLTTLFRAEELNWFA